MVPVAGYVPLTEDFVDWLWHLVLPWTVLAIISAAMYARLVRSDMLDNLQEDYVRTLRAQGLPERVVIGRHVMRNIALPIITFLCPRFWVYVGWCGDY